MEFRTLDIKHGSVCALVGYQWCGGLYFAAAAISTDICPPQISIVSNETYRS